MLPKKTLIAPANDNNMTPERRESPRLPVGIDVVLNHRSQAVVCTLKDISFTGAFVDAEPELLPYHGQIELGWSVAVNGETKEFRVPAVIRRQTEQGVGVSFREISRDAYFSLIDLYAGKQ